MMQKNTTNFTDYPLDGRQTPIGKTPVAHVSRAFVLC